MKVEREIIKIEKYFGKIYCVILIPKKFNKKYVIFSYGIIGQRPDSSNPLIYKLLELGFACVLYDYEGCYNSYGSFSFYKGLLSLKKILRNLEKMFDEIILVGISYGSLLNLHVLEFKKVSKIVCISTPVKISTLKKHLKSVIRKMRKYPTFRISKNPLERSELLDLNYQPQLEFKDILFIHGKYDNLTKLLELKKFIKKFKLKLDVMIIPAGHVGFWIFNNQKILNKVIKFLLYWKFFY